MSIFKQGMSFEVYLIFWLLWVTVKMQNVDENRGNVTKFCGKPINILCDCGPKENDKKVSILVKMCPVKDVVASKKLCAPCFEVRKSGHPCHVFKDCESCSALSMGCDTCPVGKRGKYCEDDVFLHHHKAIVERKYEFWDDDDDDVELPFSGTMDKYSSWLPNSRSHRIKKRQVKCRIPETGLNMDMQCISSQKYISCYQRCYWGHTFEDGVTRESICKYDGPGCDKWEPDLSKPCKPFVNCDLVKLNPRATIECDNFKLFEPVKCRIKCPNSKEEHESTCTLDSKWHPPLPNCVAKAPAQVNCALEWNQKDVRVLCDKSNPYGTRTCEIHCPNGVDMTCTCNSKSQWNPPLPKCVYKAPGYEQAPVPNCLRPS